MIVLTFFTSVVFIELGRIKISILMSKIISIVANGG